MIPHNRPCIGCEEAAAVVAVLNSGWLAQGKEVAAFEDEVCALLGLSAGHGVAVSSGSAALYLALLALKVKGQKVAAPAYSCRALQNAIRLAGAEPEWIDVKRGSPNLDTDRVSDGGARVAVFVHMFGIPIELPNNPELTIVEDCAQALGAKIAGKMVGTMGRVGVFSFAATKVITTGGQGGMVVSRDPILLDFVRKVRDYDTTLDTHPRFNFQMTDVQASIGRRQLSKLAGLLSRRDLIFQRYRETGIDLLDSGNSHCNPIRFRAVMRVTDPLRMRRGLADAGISTIIPVMEDELLAPATAVPHAAELCRETLSLPIFPALSDQDVDCIVRQLVH